MAVDDHAGLCITLLTIEDSKFWAGWVGCGAWSDVGSLSGVTKLTLGSWLFTASVMIEVAGAAGTAASDVTHCEASQCGIVP